MNRDDIIRMAYEAGIRVAPVSGDIHPNNVYWHEVERFASLVAAAERDRMVADGWRQCAVGQTTSQFCVEAEQLRLDAYKQGYAVGAEAERIRAMGNA